MDWPGNKGVIISRPKNKKMINDKEKYFYLTLLLLGVFLLSSTAFGISLDGGEDMSGEFTTAASLLRTFDRIIFGWGSPLVGAIFLFWSTWALIQQKIVMFFIALIAAIFILIVPKFIKDLNSLNDGTIFSNAVGTEQVRHV